MEFERMAKAVKAREIALAGLGRWQKKVDAAEAEIAKLAAEIGLAIPVNGAQPVAAAVDPQPVVPSPNGLPAEYAETAQ